MRASSSWRCFGVEQLHRALRDAVAGGLADAIVRVALRGDLRQVGHAQHLALLAERAQLLPDDVGDRAADAGIDLVEHHRRHRVHAQRGDLDRQRDARQLAAGSDLAQRRAAAARHWRRPGIRRVRRPAGRDGRLRPVRSRSRNGRRPCPVRRSARWWPATTRPPPRVARPAAHLRPRARRAWRSRSRRRAPAGGRRRSARSPVRRPAASRCVASACGATRCLRASSCRRARRRSSSSNCAGSTSRSARTRSSSTTASSTWIAAASSMASTSPRRGSCSCMRARSLRTRCSCWVSDGASSPPRRARASSQVEIRAAACAWRRCWTSSSAIDSGSSVSRSSSASWCASQSLRSETSPGAPSRALDSASRSRSRPFQWRARGADTVEQGVVAGVGIEQGQLAGLRQQCLVLVLAMDLDHQVGDFAELRQGDRAPVDPGPGAAVGADRAAEVAVVAVLAAPARAATPGPGTHRRGRTARSARRVARHAGRRRCRRAGRTAG